MEFPKAVEKAVNEIEGFVPANIAEENKRWYAVKLLERDSKVKRRSEPSGFCTVQDRGDCFWP